MLHLTPRCHHYQHPTSPPSTEGSIFGPTSPFGRGGTHTAHRARRFGTGSNETMSAYRKEGGTVDDMGLLRTTIEVENLDRRGPARSLLDTMVATGGEYSGGPRDVLEGLRNLVERKQGFVV